MTDLKERTERWAGDRFISWMNDRRVYRFEARAGEAPDLVYANLAGATLRIEVTGSYYDAADAKFKWLGARGDPEAPVGWSGVDFEKNLVSNINAALEAKCGKDYGAGCVLVVWVSPNLTTIQDMDRLVPDIVIPSEHKFEGIYLVGDFGTDLGGSGHEEKVWPLFEAPHVSRGPMCEA